MAFPLSWPSLKRCDNRTPILISILRWKSLSLPGKQKLMWWVTLVQTSALKFRSGKWKNIVFKFLEIFFWVHFWVFKRWVQLCWLSKICKTGELSLGEGVINGDKGFCANVDRLPGPLSASACSRIPLQKEPGWSSLGSCCPPASPWTSRPRFPSSFNSFFLTRRRNPTIKALGLAPKPGSRLSLLF